MVKRMRLIDADAFVEANKDIIDNNIDTNRYEVTLRELINEAPTVEAYIFEQVQDLVALNKKLSEERPHGEWIDTTGNNDFVCSVCKHKAQIGCIEYCGNCGADMRRKEGEKK